jgi:hypothetical protein
MKKLSALFLVLTIALCSIGIFTGCESGDTLADNSDQTRAVKTSGDETSETTASTEVTDVPATTAEVKKDGLYESKSGNCSIKIKDGWEADDEVYGLSISSKYYQQYGNSQIYINEMSLESPELIAEDLFFPANSTKREKLEIFRDFFKEMLDEEYDDEYVSKRPEISFKFTKLNGADALEMTVKSNEDYYSEYGEYSAEAAENIFAYILVDDVNMYMLSYQFDEDSRNDIEDMVKTFKINPNATPANSSIFEDYDEDYPVISTQSRLNAQAKNVHTVVAMWITVLESKNINPFESGEVYSFNLECTQNGWKVLYDTKIPDSLIEYLNKDLPELGGSYTVYLEYSQGWAYPTTVFCFSDDDYGVFPEDNYGAR